MRDERESEREIDRERERERTREREGEKITGNRADFWALPFFFFSSVAVEISKRKHIPDLVISFT